MHAFQFPASKLKASLIFAATDDVRYCLNGVLFTKAPNGAGILAVSTDGHRMTLIFHAQDVSTLPDGFNVIVPRDELATAAKNPVKAGRSFELDLVFQVEQITTTDATGTEHVYPVTVSIKGSVSVECKAIDGKYPDWQRVIPSTFGPIEVRGYKCDEPAESYACIDAAYLGDYAKAAKALGGRITGISFAQGKGGGAFLVNLMNQPDFVSVLMSMRGDYPARPDFLAPPTAEVSAAEFESDHPEIAYANRVAKLEAEGLTTSDAQAAIEAEDMQIAA